MLIAFPSCRPEMKKDIVHAARSEAVPRRFRVLKTSIQGCVREAEEEIGIQVRADALVLLRRTFWRNNIFDDYALIYDFPIEKAVINPEEVSEIKWASADEIKRLFCQGHFMANDISDIENVTQYINVYLNSR